MSHRPASVTIIASFLFVATVIAIFVGSSILFPNPLMYRLWELNRPGETVFVSIGGAAVVFLIALGIGTCAAGFGLLRRKRWAWWFAVVLFVVDASGDVVSLFVTGEVVRSVVGVAVSAAFLMALLRHAVREYFFGADPG